MTNQSFTNASHATATTLAAKKKKQVYCINHKRLLVCTSHHKLTVGHKNSSAWNHGTRSAPSSPMESWNDGIPGSSHGGWLTGSQ